MIKLAETHVQLEISSDFDSGNIEVIDALDKHRVLLAIRSDFGGEHRQWFHFRAAGLSVGAHHRFTLVNAGSASYVGAWPGYRAMASYDRQHWFRIPTHYDDDGLHFTLEADHQQAWFAYFEPYSRERHVRLIDRALRCPGAALLATGNSIEGRKIELLRFARPDTPPPLKVWIIAQQHPGEHMAEWFAEGVVEALESFAEPLLDHAQIYLVPNMNPDGSFAGHLRCNAAGVDLNRAWMAPNETSSPEVLFIQKQMQRHGVDLFLDVHGDEEIPYVFLAGSEGNPGFTERLVKLESQFRQLLLEIAEFQTDYGYPADSPDEADLSIACNYVGQTYDCLSLTLEMPFKDHDLAPCPETGWNGRRSMKLAGNVLEVIAKIAPHLR